MKAHYTAFFPVITGKRGRQVWVWV